MNIFVDLQSLLLDILFIAKNNVPKNVWWKEQQMFQYNVIPEVELWENLKIYHIFIFTSLLTIHDQSAELLPFLVLQHQLISCTTNIWPK